MLFNSVDKAFWLLAVTVLFYKQYNYKNNMILYTLFPFNIIQQKYKLQIFIFFALFSFSHPLFLSIFLLNFFWTFQSWLGLAGLDGYFGCLEVISHNSLH